MSYFVFPFVIVTNANILNPRAMVNVEIHNLYCSPSIIRIIKSRKMRWAAHVVQMGEKRNVFWWESRKERDH
jgi:hypothetical protein